MKKFFIIVLIFASSVSYAQFQAGFKAGLSLADLQEKGANNGLSANQAFYGGTSFSVHLNSFLQLQTELNYSPQGGQKTSVIKIPAEQYKGFDVPSGTSLYANLKTTIRINYLEIPFLAKMTFGRKLKYSVLMGPYVAILLSARRVISGNSQLYVDNSGSIPFTYNNSGAFISSKSTTDIRHDFKPLHTGVQGGMNIQYPAGPGFITLEWRSIVGTGNIRAKNLPGGRISPGSLVLATGYFFKF